MNAITLLIIAVCLFPVIFCQKNNPKSSTPPSQYPKNDDIVEGYLSLHPNSIPDEFDEMDIDDFMKLLSEYLDNKQPAASTPKPATSTSSPALTTTSSRPTPSPVATKDKKIDSTGQPVTPNTKGLAPNVTPKILNYRAGKTALISADGTLKINGKTVYNSLPELKPTTGYAIHEKDGTLSVNGKVVFKNDSQSKVKIPMNVTTNFDSDTNWLRITVANDGTLKFVDNNGNVFTF